jgi:hypothetical protein
VRWLSAVIAAGATAGLAWARLHQVRHDPSTTELAHRAMFKGNANSPDLG